MTPESFRRFRRMMGMSQTQLGVLLGYTRKTIQHKERGMTPVTHGDDLACAALSMGVRSYDGPAPAVDYDQKRRRKENKR